MPFNNKFYISNTPPKETRGTSNSVLKTRPMQVSEQHWTPLVLIGCDVCMSLHLGSITGLCSGGEDVEQWLAISYSTVHVVHKTSYHTTSFLTA